ncbi:hypothetical protein BGX38DRAFT_1269266 [Terfezia claveryi]|nr:hypothetical protein BGX38DRAFT_1269266 [Terfezia claveryi]
MGSGGGEGESGGWEEELRYSTEISAPITVNEVEDHWKRQQDKISEVEWCRELDKCLCLKAAERGV